jgi:hypothetical protein
MSINYFLPPGRELEERPPQREPSEAVSQGLSQAAILSIAGKTVRRKRKVKIRFFMIFNLIEWSM